MSIHPLVSQLRFARSEFTRGLNGITDEDARRRFEPMNSISWIIAHMAWHEQWFWIMSAQNKILLPQINDLAAYGQPASTPPLDEMWESWRVIVADGDPYLDTLTTDKLTTFMIVDGQPLPESIGSMLRRITYHYWYHIGESQAIRQLLGHTNLPDFVGRIHAEAPYLPEAELKPA